MQMWKQNRNRISRFSNLSICVIICYSPLPCLVRWSVSDCYLPTAAGPFNSARDPQPTPIQTSLLSCCMFLSEKKKKTTFLLLFLFRMFCYHVASYGFILLEDNIFRHKTHSGFLEYPPPRARYASSCFLCFHVWCGFIVSFTCSRGVQSPACPCFASGAALLFKRHFNVMLCIYKMFLDFILDFSISCFFHLPF